jgi:AcrR family transcriptional regulator
MVRPAQTARSERTREALRQAALVRFLAQGVEDTSAEQIAADAGVSLRTFYRHFRSKHDLLFADYTGLHWFRAALDDRPADEPIIDSVQSAIFSFPYDVEAVTKIAALRGGELDPGRIVRHIQDVQADFAEAIQAQLQRRSCAADATPDERLRTAVTARRSGLRGDGSVDAGQQPVIGRAGTGLPCGAGIVARRHHRCLGTRPSFVIIDKTLGTCQPAFLEGRT